MLEGGCSKEDMISGLFTAAKYGKKECLQILLDSGLDVNCLDEYDNTLLMVAIQYSGVDLVEYLLPNIKDINKINGDGNTALHMAALEGYTEVVRMLVESGADKSICDRWQNTALMKAAQIGHTETVRYLVSAGFEVNAKNDNNETALHKAIFTDKLEPIRLLVEAGADIHACTVWGHTPLHSSILFDKHNSLKYLLEMGADFRLKDEVNWTVLHIACRTACTTCLDILLNYCNIDDINRSDRNDPLGLTPLCIAVHYKFLDGVKMLIKSGALIKGIHGECLLKVSNCIQDGKYEIVRILVLSGQLTNLQLFEEMSLVKQDKLDEQGKEVIKDLLATPRSLQHLCRIFIRKELSESSEGERHGEFVYRNLKKEDVYSLQLPSTVKEYLLFSDL